MLLSVLAVSAGLAIAQDPAPPAAPAEEAVAASEPAAAPAAGAPDATRTEIAAGLKAFARGHFVTARAHFQKAADASPNDAAAVFYLAYATYKVAEREPGTAPGKKTAKDLFARAYQLDPEFRPVWAGPAD